MTQQQFSSFCDFRSELKSYCERLNASYESVLRGLVKEAAKRDTPDYPLETAVVYNTALDRVSADSDIKLIVIGDNPGKDEQRAENRAYLVGQSGKLAAGFFSRHAELGTDFRKNALILNKTPIHTAKTHHLKFLASHGGAEIKRLILDSQLFMAEKTAALHQALLASSESGFPALWLVGYAELKANGIFVPYRDALFKSYGKSAAWERVFVFQHFSMNRFSIDLKQFQQANPLPLADSLRSLGARHRREIFGS